MLLELFKNSDGVTIDSREDVQNKLFFALKGDNFDGNTYAEAALEKGAKAVIVDDEKYASSVDEGFYYVENALLSLQQLAKAYRESLNTPVIGITGTNGKTTTKELIAAVLSKRYKLTATKGNLNNHIGVPLTLLSIKEDDEMAIIEMGANHMGEIEVLCNIAQPHYGIITNVGKAHLEGFGSYENVIKAKTELYAFLKKTEGMVFFNHNDNLLLEKKGNIKAYSYAIDNKDADVILTQVSSNPFLKLNYGGKLVQTSLIGDYNKYNVSAAIAFGEYFKLEKSDIINALSAYVPNNNRSQLLKTNNNRIILDAYNANPTSMRLAIDNFFAIPSKNKMLVLGDMFELGKDAAEEHMKIIQYIEDLSFQKVFLVGENFNNLEHSFHSFATTEESLAFFLEQKFQGYDILIKASRGMKLENLKDAF